MAEVIIPKDRIDLGAEAACELIALFGAIEREQRRDVQGESEYLLNAMFRRAETVGSVVLSIVGADEACTTQDLRAALYGAQLEGVGHGE